MSFFAFSFFSMFIWYLSFFRRHFFIIIIFLFFLCLFLIFYFFRFHSLLRYFVYFAYRCFSWWRCRRWWRLRQMFALMPWCCRRDYFRCWWYADFWLITFHIIYYCWYIFFPFMPPFFRSPSLFSDLILLRLIIDAFVTMPTPAYWYLMLFFHYLLFSWYVYFSCLFFCFDMMMMPADDAFTRYSMRLFAITIISLYFPLFTFIFFARYIIDAFIIFIFLCSHYRLFTPLFWLFSFFFIMLFRHYLLLLILLFRLRFSMPIRDIYALRFFRFMMLHAIIHFSALFIWWLSLPADYFIFHISLCLRLMPHCRCLRCWLFRRRVWWCRDISPFDLRYAADWFDAFFFLHAFYAWLMPHATAARLMPDDITPYFMMPCRDGFLVSLIDADFAHSSFFIVISSSSYFLYYRLYLFSFFRRLYFLSH